MVRTLIVGTSLGWNTKASSCFILMTWSQALTLLILLHIRFWTLCWLGYWWSDFVVPTYVFIHWSISSPIPPTLHRTRFHKKKPECLYYQYWWWLLWNKYYSEFKKPLNNTKGIFSERAGKILVALQNSTCKFNNITLCFPACQLKKDDDKQNSKYFWVVLSQCENITSCATLLLEHCKET